MGRWLNSRTFGNCAVPVDSRRHARGWMVATIDLRNLLIKWPFWFIIWSEMPFECYSFRSFINITSWSTILFHIIPDRHLLKAIWPDTSSICICIILNVLMVYCAFPMHNVESYMGWMTLKGCIVAMGRHMKMCVYVCGDGDWYTWIYTGVTDRWKNDGWVDAYDS